LARQAVVPIIPGRNPQQHHRKALPRARAVLLAGLFGVFVLQGLSPSSVTSGRVVLLMAVLALCCVGVGLFMARGARDTSVQVVLDENGFRDRRRGDVLVPWAKVRGVRSVSGRMGRVVMLTFELTEPMPDEIKYGEKRSA